MGNHIETVKSMGSDYWAAYVGWQKIKTDGLKQKWQTRTDVITHDKVIKVSCYVYSFSTNLHLACSL